MSEIEKLATELVAMRHQSKPASLNRRAALGTDLAELVLARKLDLVGQAEIGEMAGVPSPTVGVWATRGKLPEPVAHLACGRIWLRSDIEVWLTRVYEKRSRPGNGRRKATESSADSMQEQ